MGFGVNRGWGIEYSEPDSLPELAAYAMLARLETLDRNEGDAHAKLSESALPVACHGIRVRGLRRVARVRAVPHRIGAAGGKRHCPGQCPDRIHRLGIIDQIIQEPLGGAHRDYQATANFVKTAILDNLNHLNTLTTDQLLEQRYQRLMSFGLKA